MITSACYYCQRRGRTMDCLIWWPKWPTMRWTEWMTISLNAKWSICLRLNCRSSVLNYMTSCGNMRIMRIIIIINFGSRQECILDSYLHASSHSASGAAEIASVRNQNILSILQTTSFNQSRSRPSVHWTRLDVTFYARSAKKCCFGRSSWHLFPVPASVNLVTALWLCFDQRDFLFQRRRLRPLDTTIFVLASCFSPRDLYTWGH